MRCIIFVERKITTRVLASLLSSIEVLSPAFRFQSLAGKNSGSNDMNHKHQQNVVESFRNGEVGIIGVVAAKLCELLRGHDSLEAFWKKFKFSCFEVDHKIRGTIL